MVLSVAMMLTMFPTGVLADDFIENTEGVTVSAEGQSNDDQGEESDTAQVNVDEDEETQPETVKPETDQAAPDQTETDQTEQPEPGSTVPDQAGTTPDDKQPAPEQPATDPAENGASDGAENTEGEQAESKTEFTVTWESEGETILTKTFAEGTSKDEVEDAQPAEDPVKEADGDVAYEFAGWTPDYVDVTADQTYTATFEEVEQDEMVNTASLVEPADFKDQSVDLPVGDTKTLTGSDSYNQGYNHGWDSSDSNAVSITTENGNKATVKAKKASSEPITITHTYTTRVMFFTQNHKDTWKITVTAPVAATSVSIEGEDSVVVFRDLQLTAKVEPENASGPYTWSSSNEEVLTVDGNGKVTGKKTGTATVMLVVGSGETAKSASKEIKVTASKKETDEALVYNLLEPGKTASSNDVSNWNGPLGKNAKVDVTGAYWTDGKNCFDNVADRVVQWPDGYDNGIVPRSDPQWDTIFENYKKDTLKKLADAGITGIDIEKTDVEKIELVPAKISKGNGTNPDKHLDCTVVVHCKGIATAIFKLKDAKPNASFEQVGGAPSYLVNGTHNVITNPETITGQEFPLHKKVGDVEYTFSGWYTNDKLEGDAVNFSNGYALHEGTTTFYAKYTAGYQVKYELDGGSWGNSDSTQYTADEGSTQVVKAEPHKDGYEFIGWTVDGLSGTTTLESGQTFTMPGNEVKFTANWRANEVTVTITGHTGTRTYDGTEQQVTGYDVTTSNPEYKASDFTFTGNDAAKGTNVGTYNMGLTADQFKNTNTNFAKVTFVVAKDGQLEITPVTDEVVVTIAGKTDTATYDGKEHTVTGYEVTDISNKLYKESDIKFTGTAKASRTDVGTTNMGLKADQFQNTNGNFKKVTFKVTDGSQTITATDAEVVVTITGNAATATYDGKEHTVTGYEVTDISNKLYKESDINFTGTAKASRTDVGTTNMGLKADQFQNTNGNFKKVTFKVTDGSQTITATDAEVVVTITGNTKTVTYNGEEQSVEGYTATITKDPSKLYTLDNIQLTGTAKASRTDVGTTNMGLKAEQFQNTSKNFTNVTFVVAKDGWLKINPYMISIEPKETTFKYNGKAPEVNAGNLNIIGENDEGLLAGHKIAAIETVGSGVDAGTYEWFSGHNAQIDDGNGHNVTKNYQISYAAKTMTITKRNVTLTSASAEKVYDGNPLANDKVTVGGDRFAEGEGATYAVTGRQTDAGESENAFTYKLWDNTKAKNYDITVKFGTLKVTPVTDKVTVTIAGHKKTVTYDGEKHEVTGYDVKNISNPLYTEADFEFVGTMTQDAYAHGVDAGEYPMGLKAEQFQNTSKNFTNVMFKVRNGQLTIDRYAILITPDDVTTEYSGKAPEVVKYTIDGEKPEGLLLDHRIASYETYGSGVDVGEYDQFSMNNAKIVDGNNNDVTKNYSISYEESKLVIIPAPLKITTNSAEKTYDGSALTAGGKIEFTEDGKTVTVADNANGMVQLKNGETVTFTVTGSQTEVGESQNTYEIKWNGSAKETNYTIAEEDVTIGTLKVNARSSGGGSSSKPTPEEEPTPTPTPTPLPTLPTTPAPTTPARRVTRSTATVTQPASRPTEQITENETPKAESEPEVIEDEETPLAPMAGGAWALVNLILMLLTVLASLLLLLGYLGKKKYAKEDEYGNALHDANGNEIIDYTRNKKGFWRVASLIPAIAAVIAFALTENMRLPMVMTDRWTLLMVIIAVVQLIVAVLCKKKKESEEDENQANA